MFTFLRLDLKNGSNHNLEMYPQLSCLCTFCLQTVSDIEDTHPSPSTTPVQQHTPDNLHPTAPTPPKQKKTSLSIDDILSPEKGKAPEQRDPSRPAYITGEFKIM